jgi:UDP-N-acetylglucosamine 1-carboxyvinyltransferase
MKERFIIKGFGGKKVLKGKIPVKGAKNAALKVLAATILFSDEVSLRNVPNIEDVERTCDMLECIGVSVKRHKNKLAIITPKRVSSILPSEIAKQLRASIVFMGPLLARTGHVSLPHPGGCVIGARPIDFFIEGFKKMGARGMSKRNNYELRAPDGLLGAEIFFKNQSVTGTETFMMAGVLAKGKTVIKNAALEPEIESLAMYLNKCGARIGGIGTPTLTIKGSTKLLSSNKKAFTIPPDRIEAGSLLILGALAARDLTVSNCNPSHLEALLHTLTLSGVKCEAGSDFVRIRNTKLSRYKSIDIKTHEYPGFPTDLQAPMTVFLTQAHGRAGVFETIFEGRFGYVEELQHMGAKIESCDPHRVIVEGPTALYGKELSSPDLRAGLAYIIAGAVAKGESVIHNVYNIDRGYERIEERLKEIGLEIRRESV